MRSILRVTPWERISVWRRILGAILRVSTSFCLLGVLIWIFGPPISVAISSRWEGRRVPAVKVSPVPLSDYSVSNAPGTVLSYFGYGFEVPWNGGFQEKVGNSMVQINFQSGQDLIFNVPRIQEGFLNELVQDESLHMKNLGPLFGDLMRRSAYDQYATLLHTTPSSVRALGPRNEANRDLTLLTLKAIAVGPGLETGAFSFQFSDKRGFQVGDPRKAKRVDLAVFDLGGRRVEFMCRAVRGNVTLSQAEINRILKTVHPIKKEGAVASGAGTSATLR
jgi:hypothetical protein